MIKKIDIESFRHNKRGTESYHSGEISFTDFDLIAEKMNEIIEAINKITSASQDKELKD